MIWMGSIPPGINRNEPIAAFLQPRDRLFVGEIVGQRETVDPRSHTIFRRFIAHLDDLLDHFAFSLVERAFLFADFHQGSEFLIAQSCPRSQSGRRDEVDNRRAGVFQRAAAESCESAFFGSSGAFSSCRFSRGSQNRGSANRG